jgi:hypothetical protein
LHVNAIDIKSHIPLNAIDIKHDIKSDYPFDINRRDRAGFDLQIVEKPSLISKPAPTDLCPAGGDRMSIDCDINHPNSTLFKFHIPS